MERIKSYLLFIVVFVLAQGMVILAMATYILLMLNKN